MGYVCPECAGGGRSNRVIRIATAGAPVFTYALMAVCVVVWLAQVFLPSLYVTDYYAYTPLSTVVEPWRMITAGFLHDPGSIFHLAFNMWSLFVLGRILEPMIGRWRFISLYFLALFGGSVGVLLLSSADTWVVGASGAIFGLMGALFIISRELGANTSSIVSVIAINLFLGFLVSGVAWQAHLGGLAVGCLVAWVYVRNRGLNQKNRTIVLLAAIGAALIVLTVIGVGLMLRING